LHLPKDSLEVKVPIQSLHCALLIKLNEK
jgi:hypothetical protein